MNQIESQLQSLRLHGMHKTFTTLLETRQLPKLSLNEGLELLLQAEAEERDNRRFKRLKQNAAFRYQASIEEIRMDPQRGVDKQLIYQLAPGDYIQKGESVLITGFCTLTVKFAPSSSMKVCICTIDWPGPNFL
jgi:DNA replication protein DnaC